MKVNIFKRVDQAMPLDRVINDIMNILPEGRTNIELGLSARLKEIRRSTIDNKIGILLTDGHQNVGHDPLTLAGKFPKLHVINLPGGKPDVSKKIAECGRGSFIPLKSMFDVSKAIIKCLS